MIFGGEVKELLEWALWLLILFALVYKPVFGYFGYQAFKGRVGRKPGARIHYYIKIMIGLWLPAIFIVLLVVLTDMTWRDIGIALPGLYVEPMGPMITYAVPALALLYCLLMAYYWIGAQFSEKIRSQLIQAKEERTGKIGFADILPVTARERKWWTAVSLTAGITEELIYRGFLIFAFSHLFPGLSIWLVMLVSSLLFGLAHTYQGTAGVIRTTAIGFAFAMLYVATGSVLLLIVIHYLIDLMAKLESGAFEGGKEQT